MNHRLTKQIGKLQVTYVINAKFSTYAVCTTVSQNSQKQIRRKLDRATPVKQSLRQKSSRSMATADAICNQIAWVRVNCASNALIPSSTFCIQPSLNQARTRARAYIFN